MGLSKSYYNNLFTIECLNTHVKLRYLKVKPQHFGHLMWSLLTGKRPRCWGRLKAKGEEGGRGWDGWMASPTQWTWIWASLGYDGGQGSLVSCSPWGHKEPDMTDQLNNGHPKMYWESLKAKAFIHQADFGQKHELYSKAWAWFSHQDAQEWMWINQGRDYSKTVSVSFHLDAMQGCFTWTMSKTTKELGYKHYTLFQILLSTRTHSNSETISSPGKKYEAKVLFLTIRYIQICLLAYDLDWTIKDEVPSISVYLSKGAWEIAKTLNF